MTREAVRGRILVVDDHAEAAAAIADALRAKGYETIVSGTAAEAKALLAARFFDLAVLDYNLGDGTGADVCRHAREKTSNRDLAVIMLTGRKDVADMGEGVEAGADYFLTKPIALEELLLWVRSLLRRVHEDWDRGSTIGVPGLRLNPDIRTVWVDDVVVRGLTAKEFDILLELSVAAPSELTARELSRRVWGREPASNTLAVHVKSLRRKLGLKGGARVATTPDGYVLR